ncbi:MAG: hypothetical protein BGO32_00225 [Bacteroidetes bacterium 37-13]|nr:MAG: hypothetical protein BGO32_00225 [Bacteroidetes bacterium 37-13]
MKIATWNLQRLDKRKDAQILDKLAEVSADICVLTETKLSIQLANYTCLSTNILPAHFDGIKYKNGECRVSILTHYKVIAQHTTFDSNTTVCVDLETPYGELTVYGSIIGVFGNKQPRFNQDLEGHISDFKNLFPNKQICFLGDFNTTFSGRAWPSTLARNTLNNTFKTYALTNATEQIFDTVEHIVLSSNLIENKQVKTSLWNTDKELSDHLGICIDF